MLSWRIWLYFRIAPGIFPSEMTASSSSDETNKSQLNKSEEEDVEWAAKKGIPAGRPGRDEDMAQAVLFLTSCEYAYGQVNINLTFIYFSCAWEGYDTDAPPPFLFQNIAVDGGYLLEHP